MVKSHSALLSIESLHAIVTLPAERYSYINRLLELGYCLQQSGFMLHPDMPQSQVRWAHVKADSIVKELFPPDSKFWSIRHSRRRSDQQTREKLQLLEEFDRSQFSEFLNITYPCIGDFLSVLYFSAMHVDKRRFAIFQNALNHTMSAIVLSTEYHSQRSNPSPRFSSHTERRLRKLVSVGTSQVQKLDAIQTEVNQLFQSAWDWLLELEVPELEHSLLHLISNYTVDSSKGKFRS